MCVCVGLCVCLSVCVMCVCVSVCLCVCCVCVCVFGGVVVCVCLCVYVWLCVWSGSEKLQLRGCVSGYLGVSAMMRLYGFILYTVCLGWVWVGAGIFVGAVVWVAAVGVVAGCRCEVQVQGCGRRGVAIDCGCR